MPAHLVVRLSLAALGFAVLAAAAPAAHAQAQPRWQVEASLDVTSPGDGASMIALSDFEVHTDGATRWSAGASRLAPLGRRASLRMGLTMSSKGWTEQRTLNGHTYRDPVEYLYVGAPIVLGYNLVNPRRGLRPFAEVGVVPELLVRGDDGKYFHHDLKRGGISSLFSIGLRYNLGDGRAVVLAPEVRIAATEYGHDRSGYLHFHPSTGGIKLGIQF